MGRLGLPEMLVILFIVILIFGASRLPDIGRGIGRGIKNFKEATRDGGGKDDVALGRPRSVRLLPVAPLAFVPPSALQHDPLVPCPPRHSLAVEIFEQRNRKFAADAVPRLEARDVDGRAAVGCRGLQRARLVFQERQRVLMEDECAELHQPFLTHEKLNQPIDGDR